MTEYWIVGLADQKTASARENTIVYSIIIIHILFSLLVSPQDSHDYNLDQASWLHLDWFKFFLEKAKKH